MSSRNIWLVRETDRSMDGIERWGAMPQPIFEPQVSPMDVRAQETHIRDHVLPHASASDLIITVGPQVMVMVLASLFMAHFGEVHLLTWDRFRGFIEKSVPSPPPRAHGAGRAA